MPGSLRNSRNGFGEGQLRVGDAERDAALAALREHYADGRLNADELDERLAAALVARTRSDLDRLFWDLPGERRAVAPTWPPAPRRTVTPWRVAGRVLGAATASAVLVGVIVTILLVTLVVTMLTFGGFLWLLVFWWLLARGFGWGCGGRRRYGYGQYRGYWQHSGYRQRRGHWQRPGRITRV